MTDKLTAEAGHQSLLQQLLQDGVLKTPEIEAAFAALPRHLFLPGVPLELVYSDQAVPLKHDRSGMVISSSSQPTMMAVMLDQLQLRPGDNVLEIGTGSGYNAALMRHIVGDEGHVTTIEFDAEIVRQAQQNLVAAGVSSVKVVRGDGARGYEPRSAYDQIVATAGIWDLPLSWARQLKPTGKIVAPIWLDGVQVSAAFSPQPDGTYLSVDNRPCAFVYLRGAAEGPGIRKQVGSSSLYIMADGVDQIDTISLHLLLSDDAERCTLESPLAPQDYWYGFQLYLMLNEPPEYVFAVYAVIEGRQAYGLEGRGIALIAPGGAAFAPYGSGGETHCFAGVDAFLQMQTLLDSWNEVGRPRGHHLRLRLIPRSHGMPEVKEGKVYTRANHYLHAWLDMEQLKRETDG